MTNGINATQADIFLFLTKRNNWQTEAETNNDGEISQNEFCKYVNANWEYENMGCETPEHDLIIRFWNKFDTNNANNDTKYLLDNVEMANLEKKLELYEKFDEYIKGIIPPNVLTSTQSQWLRSVKEDLSALLESYTGEADNLAAHLEQHRKGIENRNTAVYCAEEAIKGQSGLPEGYKPAEDSTLQGIIQNYCNRINDAINPQDIKNDIDKIIAAYLKTAGIGEGSSVNLSEYGYDPNNWNDLQKETIVDIMMGWFGDTYNNDPELHDKYIGMFLEYLEESNKTFSQVNDSNTLWTVFIDSDPGKKLRAIRVVLNGAKDISWNIYEELINTLGYEVATIIKDNDKDTTVYQDALYELIGKIESGEITDIDPNDIKDLVIDIVVKNLNNFQDDLTRKVPAEKVIDIYTDMYYDMDFSNGDLEELREKSIQCCDLLVKKGGKIGMAVIETFSTAYRSDIEKMDFSTLKSKMTSLNDKIIAIKNEIDDCDDPNKKEDVNKYVPYSSDPDSDAHTNCDFGWWGQWSDNVVGTNDTLDLTKWNIHNSDSYKDGPLKNYPITYEYDVISGLGSINDDKFIPGDEAGTAKITITATIAGVYISHTNITVKIVEGDTPATEEPGDTSAPVDDGGQNNGGGQLTLDKLTLADLGLSGSDYGYSYGSDFDMTAGRAMYDIGQKLKSKVDTLNLSDDDKEKFKNSIDSQAWATYFNNLFDAIDEGDIRPAGNDYDHNVMQDKSITFNDINGDELSVQIAYGSVSNGEDDKANQYAKEWALASSSGVGICKEKNGKWRVAIAATKAFDVLKSYF